MPASMHLNYSLPGSYSQSTSSMRILLVVVQAAKLSGMVTEADMQQLLKTMGERIRTRRKSLGLTQEKLAEKSNKSSTFIAKLEAGVKTPSLDTLVELGEALEIDAADLIRKREETSDLDRAKNISDALNGLSPEDAAFVLEELLHLTAHLRKK